MSSANLRAAGFAALLATNGEPLTYNAGQTTLPGVQGVVNRRTAKLREVIAHRPNLDFQLMGLTEIELLMTAMPEPSPGGFFTDGLRFRHQIKTVTSSDITWVCACERSKVT